MNKNIIGRKLLERFPQLSKKVTWPQTRAFSVHLLTASGSFLAFLSLVAAAEQAMDRHVSCGWGGWRSSSTA